MKLYLDSYIQNMNLLTLFVLISLSYIKANQSFIKVKIINLLDENNKKIGTYVTCYEKEKFKSCNISIIECIQDYELNIKDNTKYCSYKIDNTYIYLIIFFIFLIILIIGICLYLTIKRYY